MGATHPGERWTTSELDSSRYGPATALNHEVLQQASQSLDQETRASMELRFGHGFGDVRIHTGITAAASALQLGAAAYTTGRHIVFGTGRYAPSTSRGQSLLAHELTHVVQQEGRRESLLSPASRSARTPAS